MKTRYYKVLRDVSSELPKNVMLVIAMAIGVFGIGTILGAYRVVQREMSANYLSTVPASATIEVDKTIRRSLVDSVRHLPGIRDAERHATRVARMKVGDRWLSLLLFVVDDFGDARTNKVHHISGALVPKTGDMLVERTAYGVMNAHEGGALIVKTTHGQPLELKLTGTVHDPGLAPAWQEQAGYGYINIATLEALGETQGFDQLRILVSDQPDSKDHITAQAKTVADLLQRAGYSVHEIQVPPPNKHPHQSQMNASMTIFIVFAYFILILGSILVATGMATLMVKQVRQIGVMKTIGANTMQVARLYLIMILSLCAVALLIAIPLSRWAASGFYRMLAALLNLEINDASIPLEVMVWQIASGIFIPLLAVAVPIIRGSRITVKKALDHYGVAQRDVGQASWFVKLSRAGFLSDIFRLSIRNVFRQRSRLVMTLGLLAAGGATFMTALNVSEAWDTNLKRIYVQRLYDLEIRLNHPMPMDTIVAKIKALPGVEHAEACSNTPTAIIKDSAFEVTQTYPDKGHGSFAIQALPLPTQTQHPTLTDGQWLSDPSRNDVVLNQLAQQEFKIGDRVRLAVEGKPSEWTVIGFTEDVGTPATAYVSQQAFSKWNDTPGQANTLRIGYTDRSHGNAQRMNHEIETLLEKEHVAVASTMPVWLLHNAVAAHMKVLVNSLMAMALLMAVVGAIGLMSMVSMSTLERTREIGVMRAIGATPRKIRRMIAWEGLLIAGLSIVVAFAVSIGLSIYMGRFIGHLAFRTPLSLSISVPALGMWLIIAMGGAYLATLYPARRASRITTREALVYE